MSKVIGSVGGAGAADVIAERRRISDRRQFTLRTIVQGALAPRRRDARRGGDVPLLLDWQQPHLVLMGVAVLLLSVTDALLTLTLLSRGATEANPVLALMIYHHPLWFAWFKMTLTGAGVIVLVVLSRAKLFGAVRAGTILRALVMVYLGVIVYELWLLGRIP